MAGSMPGLVVVALVGIELETSICSALNQSSSHLVSLRLQLRLPAESGRISTAHFSGFEHYEIMPCSNPSAWSNEHTRTHQRRASPQIDTSSSAPTNRSTDKSSN